jgi:hypothetical protein
MMALSDDVAKSVCFSSWIYSTEPVYYRFMKNITVTVDARTAAWARIYAARHNQSLSRFVGELLHSKMRESREYDEAMQRFLSKQPVRLNSSASQYPSREDLHDRSGLR